MAYNLWADKHLKLNLFPTSLYTQQTTWYPTVERAHGPLRSHLSLTDLTLQRRTVYHLTLVTQRRGPSLTGRSSPPAL
jgi:hypothetical protein